MENIVEEEKTSCSNASVLKGKSKSNKNVKEKYFLIKKCKRNNSTFLGKKTLIRKKIRKISSNLINNKNNSKDKSSLKINKNKNNNYFILDKNIKKKLIIINFNSAKKLCEFIINNFSLLFNNKINDEKNKENILFHIWQCLNILNNKINKIQKEKMFKPGRKELDNFYKIKDILLNLKKNLCEKMSKNLRHILNNIDIFCNKYSK